MMSAAVRSVVLGALRRGVPAWVLSGAALDFDFVNGRGFNSIDRAKLTPDSILTYTAPSPKMVTGADGVLRYANHNLVPYSQDFSSWTKNSTGVLPNQAVAPDGTMTASLMYPTSSGVGRQLRFPLNQISGTNKLVRIRAKAAGLRWLTLTNPRANAETDVASFDLVNGVMGTIGAQVVYAGIVALGDGWYECTLIGPCDNTDFVLFQPRDAGNGVDAVTANGTAGFYIWGAELKSYPVDLNAPYVATTGVARYSLPINYDPITHAPLGVLIEEQRTNLLTYSEQFDNAAWTKLNAAISTNASVAPDGTTTAGRLIGSGALVAQRVSQNPLVTGAHTFTVYAKAGTHNFVQLLQGSDASFFANFDLSTGSVGTKGAGTAASIQAVGGGWYRCSATWTIASASAHMVYLVDGASASYGAQSATANGVYIWGAQLEAGAFATSYIPTVASQVTRTADNVSILTSAFGYVNDGYTLYSEMTGIEPGFYSYQIGFQQNSGITDGAWFTTNTTAGVNGRVRSGGGDSANFSPAPSVSLASGFVKQALVVATNDFAYTKNGNTVAVDAAGAVPSGITKLSLLFYLNGKFHIKRLTYFPVRKTNADLQVLST